MSVDAQQQLHLLLDAAAKGLLQLGTAMHKRECIRDIQGCNAGSVWHSNASFLAWKQRVTLQAIMCYLTSPLWTILPAADDVLQFCGQVA